MKDLNKNVCAYSNCVGFLFIRKKSLPVLYSEINQTYCIGEQIHNNYLNIACAVRAIYASCAGTAAHRHNNRIMYVAYSCSSNLNNSK